MLRQIISLAALFASYGLISLGHSALMVAIMQQGANSYHFSEAFLGILVSVSFLGYFIGNYLFVYLLPRISYIRTFAVCSAAISVSILLLPIFASPTWWLISRLFYGLCFSCTVIICDSWINSVATNDNRQRLMAIGMIIVHSAYGLSQYMLVIGDTMPQFSFPVAAAATVISLIPVCLTTVPEPHNARPTTGKKMSLIGAYRTVPLAFVNHFIIGMMQSGSWMFITYVEGLSLPTEQGFFLSMAFFLGALFLQVPVGWISDRCSDRRRVIASVSGLAALFSLALFFGGYYPFVIISALALLFNALNATSYTINLAYGQDFVSAQQAPQYTARIFQVYSAGGLLGPAIIGVLMEWWSMAWLFGFMAFAHVSVAAINFAGVLAPKQAPVDRRQFEVVTATSVVAASATPTYSESEVGPTLPDAAVASDGLSEESCPVVGPEIPIGEQSASPLEEIGPSLAPEVESRG